MRKRFYILFVARDSDGQLHKVPIPFYYLYLLLAGGLIGVLSLTGIAGSYARMLAKVSQFNQLRFEKEALKTRYSRLEEVAQEKDIQVASLGALASEVSALYGLKSEPILANGSSQQLPDEDLNSSIEQLYGLRKTALSGAATIGIGLGLNHTSTMSDWVRASAAPTLWPVSGRITGSFGERIDPFNGEGAFHRGVDISGAYGEPVIAPADGEVVFAHAINGYGRTVILDHGHSVTTLYGHLSNFAVIAGQEIHRGNIIGYIGLTGRSTGPHLHYEVRIHDTPVNPYKYLRITLAHSGGFAAGS